MKPMMGNLIGSTCRKWKTRRAVTMDTDDLDMDDLDITGDLIMAITTGITSVR
jgi:hypothetical protein